jgi:hypothetical protein
MHSYPLPGAFFWEKEYWKPFQPECGRCRQPMMVRHSIDEVREALVRLPGFKAHEKKRRENLQTRLLGKSIT